MVRVGRRAGRLAAALVAVAVAGTGFSMTAPAPAGAVLGPQLDPMISVRVRHVAGDAPGTVKVAALGKIGATLYVGGNFPEIAPEREPNTTLPAGAGIPRPYLFAVDATTGVPKWGWGAQVDGPVYAIEVDPATNTVWVGGDFATVNGQAQSNFAAFDGTTGALKGTQFSATGGVNPDVRAIHRHALTGKLYVGGDFEFVTPSNDQGNPRSRGELFRLDLATNTLDSYKIQVTGTILSIAVDPDAAVPDFVYVGGEFATAGPLNDPAYGYLAAFAAQNPAEFAELRTAWDTQFSTANDPRVRSLALKSGRLYAAIGGGGGWFTAYDTADGAARPVNWRADGDVQVVKVVDNQVLVGGHFTRLPSMPDPATGQSYTLRCQLFSVPLTITQAGAPSASPNVLNSAHYGPFALVAEGTDGNLDTYWGGHLARITQGPDPTPVPFTASQGVCANGVQDTWGGLWHLRDTPQPDTTKPTTPGVPVVTGAFTAATVTWSPATDNRGVAAYYVFVNDVRQAVVAGNVTTAQVTGLVPDAANAIRVRAVDAATNFRDSATASWPAGQAIPALPSPLNGFGQFFPSPNPVRVLDTRRGIGRPGTAPLASGAPLAVPIVTAQSGVPSHAQLVALNVTVVGPSAAGFLTVAPNGVAMPDVSNLNFQAGQTVPNLVVARLGNGTVDVQVSAGAAHVLFDVVGWFGSGQTPDPGARLAAQTPVRKLDSRRGIGMPGGTARPFGPGETIEVPVVAPGSGVKGVVLNLTGVGPSKVTYVTAFPGDQTTRPDASNLNLVPGQIRPNLVMVGVSPNGTVKLFNESGSVHLLADLVGTFTGTTVLDDDPTGRMLALDRPQRMVDTRATGDPLGPGAEATPSFASVDAATVASVKGLVMNVTAVRVTASTYLTLFPPDAPRPLDASNLNAHPGEDVPNLAVAALSADDRVGIYNFAGSVDYIFDVTALVLG